MGPSPGVSHMDMLIMEVKGCVEDGGHVHPEQSMGPEDGEEHHAGMIRRW